MPEVIDNIEVGKFIKSLLRKNGMTQEMLAQKLMISKSAVSQNLNGKSSFDIQNLMAIAKIFNISLDDLINCRLNEEEDNYKSEYIRFANKGLENIKKYKSKNLRIQEPDIYGKVLVDYLIDQDILDIFEYLNNEDVEFVHDYYHRAKDIYLKIIVYMLRKNIHGVIKYIKKYSEIASSFDITQTYKGLEVWTLLNDKENEEIIKQMIDLKINQEFIVMGIKRKKQVKAIPKDIWVECIGMYKLNNVLDVYLNNYAKREDILSFTSSMLLFEYSEGVEKFIKKFFSEEYNDNFKSYYKFQKVISLVIKNGDFDLFKKFINLKIYQSLTSTIVSAISDEKKEFYEYCLQIADNKIYEKLDYSKIGLIAVIKSNLSVLEIIKESLNQNTLNYLLSEVKEEDIEMLYYLIALGAKFDFKYYNSSTMKKTNAIIAFLYQKEVK